ncbi:TetR/AcrR family transcriptional regulator [Reyranella soli]|jgi:TetR/AcrR family transcriptional repressor of nem operon|uniref:TetR family transcriptional regulator n=1 Tax=Reyranella soli TaxID=1230389 RepID=A0A512N236_9HYPH|nr:TetR/AcrR family transcriptional regulator [Reyranella soli]GEP53042.1 TetR family transcriptional regulator [Reyranella soli]
MRVSRQKAMENRQLIVDAASRLFRDEGFDGVGVDAIMKEAELTHGGFYGHFASKDALMAEAMAHAVERSTAWQERLESLPELVAAYLSDRHRTDRANGCVVAALGADAARQSPGLRKAITAGIRQQLDRIVSLLKRGTPAARRRHAIATYAGMVGALTLARAVDDPALAREILTVARDAFGK